MLKRPYLEHMLVSKFSYLERFFCFLKLKLSVLEGNQTWSERILGSMYYKLKNVAIFFSK